MRKPLYCLPLAVIAAVLLSISAMAEDYGPLTVSGNLGSMTFAAARVETRTLVMQNGPDGTDAGAETRVWYDAKMITVQPGSEVSVRTPEVYLLSGQNPDTLYADTYTLGALGYYVEKEDLETDGMRQTRYLRTLLQSGTVDAWFDDAAGNTGDLYYVALDETRHGFAEVYFLAYGSEAPPYSDTGFSDVPAGAYYEDAVRWAAETGVTNGFTPSMFGPNRSCTRGQAVTFLWRACGSPAPETSVNPFADVGPESPFYQAILWACENNITNGITPTSFYPQGECTYAHVLTFLWRAMDQPAPSGPSAVAEAVPAGYYSNALAWADAAGLLADTKLSQNPSSYRVYCPRSDIVTYLYRYTTA